MRIKTSKGTTHDIRVMCEMLRNKNRALIELEDSRPLSEIAAEFDGLEWIRKYMTAESTAYEMYEGFTRLCGIQRTETGTVRLTLEKGVVNDE